MSNNISLLHKLAAVAIDSPAGKDGLVRVADLVRDAVKAEQVFVVYTDDQEALVCSDSRCQEGLPTNDMGLWLIGHQIEIAGGPIGFDIEDGRVGNIISARDAEAHSYLAFSVASSEGSGEMLIIRMKPPPAAPPGPALFAFVEAASPAVTLVLDDILGLARATRQKEQMMTLANAAELLIQAEHVQPVLEDLATVIATSSGYDLVTIDVYDAESQSFVISVVNRSPQVETSLGARWRQQADGSIYPESALRGAAAQRKPLFFSDLQNDQRVPEYGREFFKRAHIYSAAQFPITFHEQFLGVLRVANQRPRSFSDTDVEIITSFASQLAVALKAVEMYKSLAESERQLKRYSEELQASMEVQHRLARTDPLTGIPNRRYIDEITKGECSRATRHKTPLAIALIDIDFFKHVNDTYGHNAGDEALVQLADLARRSCRRGDLVGRYGGDEFLFVLPKAGVNAALKFANRFRANVADRLFSLSSELNVGLTISVGVAEFDQTTQKSSVFIKQADEALYEAKEKGRNRTAAAGTGRKAA